MDLKGILPALVTPFDDKGQVDYAALKTLLNYQLDNGVDGFVPMGSTGEYYAMSAEERRDVLKAVYDIVAGRGLLIAGTNAGSTRDVIAHTEAARAIGYDTVLLAPPYYALPSPDELNAHYQALLDAVDVNLVLYNYPPRVGVECGFPTLDHFADNPRVLGIKESSGSLQRAIEIKHRYGDKYQLSCGSDDIAFDFFMWGATSWICGPANCVIEPCVALYKKFMAGDVAGAQAQMRRLFPTMANLEAGKFVQKVKYGCELAGIPVGDTRRPLLPLTADEKHEFETAFRTTLAA